MKSNELNLCNNSNLFNLPFTKRHILKNLSYIKSRIINCYQRIRYGVSRYDAWDFNDFLYAVIENGLKYLKDAGNSYPGWCTYEEWQTKLEYMIKLSELSNRYEDEVTEKSFDKYLDTFSKYGKDSEECKKAHEEWMEDEQSFEITKYNSRHKLLKELEKYIDDLWD
jgi:hypothetical protein